MPFKSTKQTLSPDRRIRRAAEFERVFCAERITNKWFVVYVRKNESGHARLGMVVSKKTMLRASARNFTKRMIRETFRREFPIENTLDIVVRVRRPISQECVAEGRQALRKILQAMQT